MADSNTPKPGADGFPNPAENNEDVAKKLAAQGAAQVPNPQDLVESSDALDKLAEQKVKEKETATAGDDEAKKKAEEEAAAKKKAEEDAAAKGGDAESKKKEADEAAAREKSAAEAKKAEELFKDSPQLPPNASPKSSEAFSSIKIKAAQEISAREKQIEELNKKNSELQEKLKAGDPAKEKELEDLRLWRAKLDVEVDPRFQEFNKTISSAQEFIYAQLKKSPAISDATIEEIKKYGGPENVNMAKIFDVIKDATTQRIVESKLADIEMAKFNRDQAINSAKENVKKYLEERQQTFEQSVTAHNAETKKAVEKFLPNLPWLAERSAGEKADAAEKQVVEDHNKFVAEQKKNLEACLNDDSPEMRAIMATGMLQLIYLQRVHDATLATVKAKDAELDKKDATIKELNDKIERMKSASLSRLRESGAPPGGQLPQGKKDPDLTIPSGQALDDIAKGVMEAKARAAASGA